MKLRHLLGDSVDATALASGEVVYSENFSGKHSPIIGWLDDGLPLYGPTVIARRWIPKAESGA